MKLFDTRSYNPTNNNPQRVSPPDSGYTFLLDGQTVFFTRSYLNPIDDDYETLISGNYTLLTYSKSNNVIFLYEESLGEIHAYLLKEGTTLHKQKILTLSDIIGIEHISYYDLDQSLYLGDSNTRTVQTYQLPYIPVEKLSNDTCLSLTSLSDTAYYVGNNTLYSINLVTKEKAVIKSYTSNPYKIISYKVNESPRLYILRELDVGLEEYLIETQSSSFYAQNAIDPVSLTISEDKSLHVAFKTGFSDDIEGLLYYFTIQENPSDTVSANYTSSLFKDLSGIVIDESRQYIYLSNRSSDLVLVLDRSQNYDPVSLVPVGLDPTQLSYNQITKQVYCLCNGFVYILEEFSVIDQISIPQASRIAIDPIRGFLLVGTDLGEVLVIDSSKTVVERFFPQVGSVRSFNFINIRGLELLVGGDNGITLCRVPFTNRNFDRDQVQPQLEQSNLPGGITRQVVNDDQRVVISYSDGTVRIFSSDLSQELTQYSHSGEVLILKLYQGFVFSISSTEIILSQTESGGTFTSLSITPETWRLAIIGSSLDGDPEIALIGVETFETVLFDLSPSLTQGVYIRLPNELDGNLVDITDGYFVNKNKVYPDNIPIRESLTFWGQSLNYNGPKILVRRESDNAELDIPLLSDRYLDEEALKNFASGSDKAYVKRIYGPFNRIDAYQPLPESQPLIVFAGQILRMGNDPAMEFDGVDDYLIVDHQSGLNLSDSIRISGQIRIEDPSNDAPQTIVSKGNYSLTENEGILSWETRPGTSSSWAKTGDLGTDPVAATAYRGNLYVSCKGSNDIYRFDSSRWLFSGNVGASPREGAVWNDLLFVCCQDDHTVYSYDELIWQQAGGFSGSKPKGLFLYDNKLWVVGEESNTIHFYSSEWSFSGSLGDSPVDILEFDNKLLVACKQENAVYIFRNNTWQKTASIGSTPLSLSLFNGDVYVACKDARKVYRFSGIDSWYEIAILPGVNCGTIKSIGSTIYLLYEGSNSIGTLTQSNWTNDFATAIGQTPVDLILDGSTYYAVCLGSDSIFSKSGDDWQLETDQIGLSPTSIETFDGKLFVTCRDSNNIYVKSSGTWSIDAASISGDIGTEPIDLATLDSTLYAICQGNNGIFYTTGDGNWFSDTIFNSTPVAFSRFEGNLIVICQGDIYRLSAGTWQIIGDISSNSNLEGQGVGGVEFNTVFYFVTTSGLFSYQSGTWEKISNLNNQPKSITFQDNLVWISASNNVVYIYDGNIVKTLGELDDDPVKIIPYGNNLIALCENGRVFSYDSNTDFWSELTTTPLGELGETIFVANTPDLLLITRPSSDDIYQWDGSTFSRFGNNTLGSRPTDIIAFNETYYVCCEGSNDLYYLDNSNNWVKQADLGLSPQRMEVDSENLYISCAGTNDVVVWDKTSISRLGECGYNPMIALEWNPINGESKLLVACDGLNGLGKGVFSYTGNWNYHGEIGDRPNGGIVYQDTPYFSCADTNNLYAYINDSWTIVAEGGIEIGEEPGRMEIHDGDLYLCCLGASNEIHKFSNGSWSINAINVGVPKDLSSYEGAIYSIDSSNNKVYKNQGLGWETVTTLSSNTPSSLLAFSAKLHVITEGSNEAFFFPSYLNGQSLEESITLPTTITFSAEFGSEVRLYVNDTVYNDSLPSEQPQDNTFNVLIGVGFDFSPSGEVAIRGDNFRGRISSFQFAPSDTLFNTDLAQSYLYSYHIAANHYYLFDRNRQSYIKVSNSSDRNVSIESSPLESVEQVIKDDRFGTLLYAQDNSLSIVSFNKRVIKSSVIDRLSLLQITEDFTVFYSNGFIFFLGKSASATLSPKFDDITTVKGQTLGLDRNTSYIANILTPNPNIDRKVVNLFSSSFILGNSILLDFQDNIVLVYDLDWNLQRTQTLSTDSIITAHYYNKTTSNKLTDSQIYLYDGKDVHVFWSKATLSTLKTYTNQSFYNPITVPDTNEIWFISSNSLRKIIATDGTTTDLSIYLINQLLGEFENKDKLLYDPTRGVITATNRRRKTLLDFLPTGELVNEYEVSRQTISLSEESAYAYDRVPLDIAVSEVDGYLYCLTAPSISSQFLREEIVIFEDGRYIENIPIPFSYNGFDKIYYSSDLSAICVRSSSSILIYQNRTLTRIIFQDSESFLTLQSSLDARLSQSDSEGWNLFDLGGDLVHWFDSTRGSLIDRTKDGKIVRWNDSVTLSDSIDFSGSQNATYKGFKEIGLKESSASLSTSSALDSGFFHIAIDIENNRKVQTILSSEKSDLTYRDEELTLTVRGEAEGFYPLSGTQGSPRSMAMFQDRNYLAVAGRDEIWKYEFTTSNGQPDSLPKWQVFQSEPSLKEPEYLYEYDSKLWCCYAYSNTIASVEDSSTREVFNFAEDKIRPRRMIEWNGNLFASFFGSDHIGKYNSTDGWSFTTVGRKPYDFAIFNSQLLVTCGGSDEIWATSDGISWSVWANSNDIGKNSEARGLLVSGSYLFVACYRSNEIRRYEDSTWYVDNFEGEGPINFEIGFGKVFVACYDSSDVYELSSPSNTTWNQNSSLGEGVYDLAFLSSPTDIALPETGEPLNNYLYALCAEDTSGQVYYSKGTTFDTFEGRDIIEYFPELDTYFSRHPKSDNEVVYFDGLHWIPCFDSAYFYSNENYNNFNLYYDSASASLWVIHDRGLFFKTVDGINWTLERGLQATNNLKGFTVADGIVYVLDEVNNSAVLHKYEGNYKWSKKYPPKQTYSVSEISTFVSQGISYLAIRVGRTQWNGTVDTEDTLWVYNPNTDNWFVEFQSPRKRSRLLVQKGNYLYIDDSSESLYDIYRADLSNYDPENGNHLQFNLVGDGSQNLSRVPSDLEIYQNQIFLTCSRGREVYSISLEGDLSLNSWTLSGSFSDDVDSIQYFSQDDSLYILVRKNRRTLFRLENGSWVQLGLYDFGVYFYEEDSRSYRGLQEYQNKLMYLGTPNFSLIEFDGSTSYLNINDDWSKDKQNTLGTLSTTINGKNVLLIVLLGLDNNSSVFFYDESQDRIEFLTFRLPKLLNRFGKTFLYYGGGISTTKAYTPYYEVNNLDTFDLQVEPELSNFFYMENYYNSGYETIEAVSNEINGEVYIVRKLQNDTRKRIYRWIYGNGNAYIALTVWRDDIDRLLRQVLAVDYGESFEVFLFSEFGGNGKIFKTSDGENWTSITYSEFTYATLNYQGTGYRIFGDNLQRRDIESQMWVNESFYKRGSTVSNLISLSGNLYEVKVDGGVNLYKKGNIVERKRQLPFYPPNDKILSIKFNNDLTNPSQSSAGIVILHEDYFTVDLQGYNEEINLNNVGETIIGSKNKMDYINGSFYSLVINNIMSEEEFYNMLINHSFTSIKAEFYKDKQGLFIQTYLSLFYKLPFLNKESIKDDLEFILSSKRMLSK